MYEKSIELLNRAVADELSAVHQYMYFHFHCDNQGIDLLSSLFKRTAIEEMLHLERLADRILFLKGDVILEADDKVESIHDVKAMLGWADRSEQSAIRMYNQFALECAANADSATKKLFEDLVMDEERHYGQFDDEMENVKRYGDSYLAQQAMERSRAAAAAGPQGGGVSKTAGQ
ncbi:MAG: manganese catalase family protein [Gammaproteobacteria bacterium]|nr:manganese catalase family protein [Gammaproteobacteria bacterium]MBU1653508.1 manganese catalase family protein [Gammaproteobacteria bacterium]MBU1961856.1 manganese catalase family protein [Gammaproteobacteria bacterium]